MVKSNKKIYKRWWFWVLAIIVIFALIPSEDNSNAVDNDTTKQTSSNTNETKKEEPKEEIKKEEPIFDFSTAELTEENIKKAVEKTLGSKLKSATITIEKEKNIIDITYNPGDVWNEKSLVSGTANTAASLMEIMFTNEKVDKVWVWTETSMQDAKGNVQNENVVNVGLSKENAKDINWKNFKTMVSGDYNALFNIADSKFIHPAIAKNLE